MDHSSSVSKYYAGVRAMKFTCDFIKDTRDFLSKLSEQVAEFTATCNRKIEKSEYAVKYGLGKEMYYNLTRGMIGEISTTFLNSLQELEKPDGPLVRLTTWIKESERTTQKVDALADTFHKALALQQNKEAEVARAQREYYRMMTRLNKAKELESEAIPETQSDRTLAKQEQKISSQESKVEIAKQKYQESLDNEFANRPPFVKAFLAEKEWLDDVEEERCCVLKTATLSFVDAFGFMQTEKFDECLNRYEKLRNDVLVGLDRKSQNNRSHASYLKAYKFPEFVEFSTKNNSGCGFRASLRSNVTAPIVEETDLETHVDRTECINLHKRISASVSLDTGMNHWSHQPLQTESGSIGDISITSDLCMSNVDEFGEQCSKRAVRDAHSVSRGKVIACLPYTATCKGHLTLKQGQIIHQTCAANTDGFAHGWIRRNKFCKQKGYYPAKCVVYVNENR